MRPLTFSFVLVVVALTAAYLPPLTEGVQQPLAPAEVRPQQAPEQALRGQLASRPIRPWAVRSRLWCRWLRSSTWCSREWEEWVGSATAGKRAHDPRPPLHPQPRRLRRAERHALDGLAGD